MCGVIYLMQEAYTQFVLTIARYTTVYTVGRTFSGVLSCHYREMGALRRFHYQYLGEWISE